MSGMKRVFVVLACLVVLPASAHAQAILAGTVKDASGAVLPGVSVEAASPVLISKARQAVTDDTGQYRITELPPGNYTLTFTLSGFATVKREGIEVSGSGVIPISIEMRIGNLSETITVSGETPVVDTQSARRQSVLSSDIINTLPATRTYGALLTAIPGVQVGVGNGSAMTTPNMSFFTANGGRANEGRMMIDGLNVAASFNGGGVSTFIYDVANAEEMQVLVSGALGEAENGGPQVNIVPKTGGNTYKGSVFYSSAGKWSTGDNLDDTLVSYGLTQPAGVINSWDVSGSGGGPIKRDRLWFFANARKFSTISPVPGLFANLYAGDATRWTYAQDPNIEVRNGDARTIYSVRLTGQVTPRNRVSFSQEHQRRCAGSTLTLSSDGCRTRESGWVALGLTGNTPAAPETFPGYHDLPYNVTQATWSSPVTSRLLLEAGYSRFQYLWAGFGEAPPDALNSFIPVTEQSAMYGLANLSYRGLYDPLGFAFADNDASPTVWRMTASYVTGAQNIKVGYQGSYQKSLQGRVANSTQLRYRFNNGTPNAFGYYIAPRWEQNDRTESQSVFAQDQWTIGRLTLQGAVRYDRAWSWAPAERNGTTLTSPFNPQPISFPETVSVAGYNDITPRMGVAYDTFGNGKTAVKVNLGRYLQAATNDENYWANNPAMRTVTSVPVRDWADGNHNYVIDCDISNPLRQDNSATGGDTCGALGGNDLNFGKSNPTFATVNPDILKGWGVRPYDWQFGASVQQQILPRVSVEVSYNRRWFGNFFVTDNLRTTAADYEKWTLPIPQNPALPDAGGTATYYNITQAASARGAQTYQTFETDYAPARTQYWHGVNINVNARLRNSLTVQGGTGTGRGVRNTCALFAALPELLSPTAQGGLATNGTAFQRIESCDVTEPFLTSFRGLAAYTIPKVDVLISANMRSVPGTSLGMGSTSATNGISLNANYVVPNLVVQQTLGRLPANGLPTSSTTVNLVNPAQVYGDRITQFDMRFAKVLRFSGRRLDVGVDLYNLFNTSDGSTFLETYDYTTNGGATSSNPATRWLRPTAIVAPRFVRFNVRVDF
jgi:Carboxypeptidase regulatory-like domain/TonB-dependent Receptor Plug Domain